MRDTDLMPSESYVSVVGQDQSNSLQSASLHAESVSVVADPSAAIDLLYMNYLGRHATPVEILALSTQLANGSRTLDTARADVVSSLGAGSYLPTAISTVYQTWGGRAATAGEVAVWTDEMNIHGATLATVRNAVLTDPLGQTYTSTLVSQAYQQWGGRMPTMAELTAWNNQFLGGLATPATVTTAVQTDPLGMSYATGIITQAYQQWGGRAPTASDIGTWLHVLQTGGTFDQIKAGILAAPLGQDYMAAQITQAYQQWGGRAPTSDEIGTWKNEIINHGATFDTVRAGIIADPIGINYINAQVTQVYQQWGGRAPTSAELATWHDTIALHGGTMATVKGDILADPLGITYATGQLTALFASHGWGNATQSDADALMAQLRAGVSFTDAAATIPHHSTIDPAILTQVYDGFAAYLGRAPTSIEAGTWSATVQADGTGLPALRASVLASGEGQAYIAAQVTAAYQQFAGRAPTGSEISTYQDSIANQGATFDDMRHAIVNTPDGRALASSSITEAYQEYLGRAPTGTELQTDLASLVQGTRTIGGVDAAVFTLAEGQTHFSDMLATLFPQLLGHQASQQEQSTWFTALFQGADYDTMRASLMLDPTSTAHRYIGTTGDDTFVLGASPGDAVISAFDGAHDRIRLGTAYASTNLLDAAHASQVLSLDHETPNVLIKLDDHNTLLLHGVTLAQLSSADFVFG